MAVEPKQLFHTGVAQSDRVAESALAAAWRTHPSRGRGASPQGGWPVEGYQGHPGGDRGSLDGFSSVGSQRQRVSKDI